jgi:hypothetical protein
MKDSLWSMDLFRCESASLRTHWVLVIMDQYSRRIIGFGVHAGTVDGVALCRMQSREVGALQNSFVAHVAELNAILDCACLEDFTLSNEDRSPTDVALEMRTRSGWL